jgi:hypothetical protein
VSHNEDVQRACDRSLIATLDAGLAGALAGALANGATAEDLLAYLRHLTGGPDAAGRADVLGLRSVS